MIRTIAINYTSVGGGNAMSIPLSYEKEEEQGIQVLKCRVDLPWGEIPDWLKPHKFELRALCSNGSYEALLNETPNIYSLDAALFMERAQEQVWQAEAPAVKKKK